MRGIRLGAYQKKALSRWVVGLLVLAVGFAVASLLCATAGRGFLADWIAETFSTWHVLAEGESYPPTWQLMYVNGDGTVALRDLGIYYFIRDNWAFIAVVFCLLCLICFSGFELARASSWCDDLSESIAVVAQGGALEPNLNGDLTLPNALLREVCQRGQKEREAAWAAERRKDELVAYLAHDIKSPLTAVSGYLSILSEAPELSDTQRMGFASIAAGKAEDISSLVDDLFEVARYNLYEMRIERVRVDLRTLLEQIADEFVPTGGEKDVAIRVDVSEDASIFVDSGKLARALGNIVKNGVAFANPGSEVVLAASLRSDGAVCVSVVDCGREISPEHMEAIFDKFYREDNARNSERGGAGLGLAIAKEIVERHGGDISGESKDGATTFTVVLPNAVVSSPV